MPDPNFAIPSLMRIDTRRADGDPVAPPMRQDFLVPCVELPRAADPDAFLDSDDPLQLSYGGESLAYGLNVFTYGSET